MKAFISGGAGFIGSNLADRLLSLDHRVTVYDNFSTGLVRFLEKARENTNFKLIEGDLLDKELLNKSIEDSDVVFHLSANADVRFGTDHPGRDIEQNTVATFNILEAMRLNGIKKIAFSSTGSVYGDTNVIPTPETSCMEPQTSLYSASKVAGECLIQAYCEGFGMQSWIFRFVSILGERYTHGHVFDFYKILKADPLKLPVLGDGHQKKSYLYIQDCLSAILLAMEKSQSRVNIINLGTDEYCVINDSIKYITNALDVKPVLEYSGGERGWIGDNPFIYLETKKIRDMGWRPELTIQEAVLKTVDYLKENEWVFEKMV
jgi:UDP-glucose 4-epimerase